MQDRVYPVSGDKDSELDLDLFLFSVVVISLTHTHKDNEVDSKVNERKQTV